MRFISGFQDTRSNNEDFALTPYLFLVKPKTEIIKVLGIGVCWGYYSIYVGVGKYIPKDYPYFQTIKNNNDDI